MQKDNIETAARLLIDGELVVIPTETVYGLAANAFDENAIKKIYELKKRPVSNPLIVHIGSIDDLHKLIKEPSDMQLALAKAFWPGPLTLVFKRSELVPDIVTAGQDTVAVRMPNNEKTLSLLNRLDFPLVAPSANPFTYISPTHPDHLRLSYGDQCPFILEDGECEIGLESTIITETKDGLVCLRKGGLAVEVIGEKLGEKVILKQGSKVITPGMHKKHYSPHTKVKIINDLSDLSKYETAAFKLITFGETIVSESQIDLAPNGNLELAAKKLYSTFYELDKADLEIILILRPSHKGLGLTINDRLDRASNQD
jgi:L-threonylcarbamoyladenylate synthase